MDIIFPTGLNFGFFMLGLSTLFLFKLKPKFFLGTIFFIFSITISGILLNFFNALNLIIWLPLSLGILFILYKKIDFESFEISFPEIAMALFLITLGAVTLFSQNYHGADYHFYTAYAFEIAQSGHMANSFVQQSLNYQEIIMPPLFNLTNAFLIQVFSIAGFWTFQSFYFILGLYPVLVVCSMFYFARVLKINTVLVGLLIFADPLIFNHFSALSRDIPLMVFSTLFFLFLYKKQLGKATILAIMCVLTKVSGLFHVGLIGLFATKYLVLLFIPLFAFLLQGGLKQLSPFISNIKTISQSSLENFMVEIQILINGGEMFHLVYFPISLIISWFFDRRLAILGLFALGAHILIYFFPVGSLRYASFVYPFETIILAYLIWNVGQEMLKMYEELFSWLKQKFKDKFVQ